MVEGNNIKKWEKVDFNGKREVEEEGEEQTGR